MVPADEYVKVDCIEKLATHQLGLSIVGLRCVNVSNPNLPVVYPAAMSAVSMRAMNSTVGATYSRSDRPHRREDGPLQ